MVEWHRRDRDGERQLTWNQFVEWMDDGEPMAAAATVRPADHHPSPPPPPSLIFLLLFFFLFLFLLLLLLRLLLLRSALPLPLLLLLWSAPSTAGRWRCSSTRRSRGSQQQDKLDKYHREKAASLEKLRTSGEADKLLHRAGIKSIGEQRRK